MSPPPPETIVLGAAGNPVAMRALFLLLLCGCATVRPLGPGEQVAQTLAQVPRDPATFGELIYVGDVAPLEAPERFTWQYERRVGPGRSTSYTREGTEPVVVEQARHDDDYGLEASTQWQFQTREVGRVRVHDGQVELSVARGGEERSATEPLREPVVVGPTLFGFITRRRAALERGEAIAVRFAVASRLETIPFVLRRDDAPPGQTRVRMVARSPLVALAVRPLVITFDAEGGLVSLDGRVPTKQRAGEGWAELDAHVTYRTVAPFR